MKSDDTSGVRAVIVAMKLSNVSGCEGWQGGECGETMQKEKKPTTVREAKQAGGKRETSEDKPIAWSQRMLEHLRDNPDGVWFSLIDKIFRKETLMHSYNEVKANGGASGVDHINISKYGERLDEELSNLSEQLRKDEYRPQAVRRVNIPKEKGETRPLGIPTVRDRIVQGAVKNVIEPIFERISYKSSYGFRPNIGNKDALRETERLLRAGYQVVVDADIKGFFDNIDHEVLMKSINTRIADGRVLKLIEAFLNQEVVYEGKIMERTGKGTPQGGVISPLLANIYLHELDKVMNEQNFKIVRYADDLVVMCKDENQAQQALQTVRDVMQKLKLELHPEKTCIVNMKEAGTEFQFLGYRFVNHKQTIKRYPRNKSINKLKDRIRKLTPRCSGVSIEQTIKKLNYTIKGWYEYFKHSSKFAFIAIDKMIRRRLRATLAKQNKMKSGKSSKGLGLVNYKWSNKFFSMSGLFDLTQNHWADRFQSARR